MSRIKSKDTTPEKTVRSLLHSSGYRFRLHKRNLPGTPDLVFRKHNSVLFINGCFWHQHKNCRNGQMPKSRKFYWEPKLLANVERDKNNITELKKNGWKVMVVWECAINKDSIKAVDQVMFFLNNANKLAGSNQTTLRLLAK